MNISVLQVHDSGYSVTPFRGWRITRGVALKRMPQCVQRTQCQNADSANNS